MPREVIAGLIQRTRETTPGKIPNGRVKQVVDRIVGDLFVAIDELDVSPDEFWSAVAFLTEAGQRQEFGLLAPGLGLEHLLDVRMDEAEAAAGLSGGTPRTIEGPLYIAGAPLSVGDARLDDGSEAGEILFVSGRITDLDGAPLAGAIVDVWHANTRGMYSHFDPAQPPFNFRRRIETDADGRYTFRTVMPAGYACPPDGPTQRLLDLIGRHAHRPAHIHYLVTAPGCRTLTTQINIDGDEYLHDDFAFATRDELIPPVVRHDDPAEIAARGLDQPFASITFDIELRPAVAAAPADTVERARVRAQAA